ncbi:MAG: hypothetical protein MJY76_06200 [Bacteroidales bacterium]|nr:hypothetical protein [Bacteroidales bacterium]
MNTRDLLIASLRTLNIKFVLIDFIKCYLIWGAVLTVILKFVTPSVKKGHEAEQSKVALATF